MRTAGGKHYSDGCGKDNQNQQNVKKFAQVHKQLKQFKNPTETNKNIISE